MTSPQTQPPHGDSIWKRHPWLAWVIAVALLIGLYLLYDRWLETLGYFHSTAP